MQNAWKMIEGFGRTHLMIPLDQSTVCGYIPNLNGEIAEITNISKTVTCEECLKFARGLRIPTA